MILLFFGWVFRLAKSVFYPSGVTSHLCLCVTLVSCRYNALTMGFLRFILVIWLILFWFVLLSIFLGILYIVSAMSLFCLFLHFFILFIGTTFTLYVCCCTLMGSITWHQSPLSFTYTPYRDHSEIIHEPVQLLVCLCLHATNTSHARLFMSVWLFSPFHCVPPHHYIHAHPSALICSIIFVMHDSTYPCMHFFDFYTMHVTKQASIYVINIFFLSN